MKRPEKPSTRSRLRSRVDFVRGGGVASCRKDESAKAEDLAADERVGDGRPPIASRFRAGQSGNPGGRPKGARNFSTVVASALAERVAVTENGRRRRITQLEAAIKQLVNRAAAGEARATALLIQLAQASETLVPSYIPLVSPIFRCLDGFTRRRRRRADQIADVSRMRSG